MLTPQRTMSPLGPAAVDRVRTWVGEPSGRGLLDLHHALAYHHPGLWGDDARGPRSVLLVRDGARQLEAFGAGEPEPALSWIARRGEKAVALLAPRGWWELVERSVGAERVELPVLAAGAVEFTPSASAVATRRLTLGDAEAFAASEAAPDWALAGWRSFPDLIAHGAAYGVPFGQGYAALAWVYSQAGRYAAVGVSTVPRFRGLGLGRASASALVAEIVEQRGQVALWATTTGNAASLALARSLGFAPVGTETYLRWRPPAGEARPR